MPNYVLTFHGEMAPMPTDQAEIDASMAQWGQWYATIGEALVDGGAPFGAHTAINGDGDCDAPASITGYTVVSADDVEGAKKIAAGCPVLAYGHTVQISESIDMSGG